LETAAGRLINVDTGVEVTTEYRHDIGSITKGVHGNPGPCSW